MTAHLFEQNEQVEGIVINNIIQLILQFADDTNLFLKATTENINRVSQWLEIAEQNLGLKVNYEKTTIYRIGALEGTNAELYTQKHFAWHDPPVKTLGFTICTNARQMAQENISLLIEKVHTVLNLWRNRELTLVSRVLVVNTLVESLFVYRFSALSRIDDIMIEHIQRDIWDYIWKGKRAKISFNILRLPKDQGGLRLCDLQAKHTVLLLQWIFKITPEMPLYTALYGTIKYPLGEDLWRCNIKQSDWHEVT